MTSDRVEPGAELTCLAVVSEARQRLSKDLLGCIASRVFVAQPEKAEATHLIEVPQVERSEGLPFLERPADEDRIGCVHCRWLFVGLAQACEDRHHGTVPFV